MFDLQSGKFGEHFSRLLTSPSLTAPTQPLYQTSDFVPLFCGRGEEFRAGNEVYFLPDPLLSQVFPVR